MHKMEYNHIYFCSHIPNPLMSLSKPPLIYVFLFQGDACSLVSSTLCAQHPFLKCYGHCIVAGGGRLFLFESVVTAWFPRLQWGAAVILDMSPIIILQSCNVMVNILYFICVTTKIFFIMLHCLELLCFVNPYVNISGQFEEFAATIASLCVCLISSAPSPALRRKLVIHSPFLGHLYSYLQYFFLVFL